MASVEHLSEQELLEALGRELLGEGIGFGPEDPGRFRRFADNWITEQSRQIRQAICDNAAMRQLFSKDIQERLADAAVVADALTVLAGHPAVNLLAVILLKRGHEQVCGAPI